MDAARDRHVGAVAQRGPHGVDVGWRIGEVGIEEDDLRARGRHAGQGEDVRARRVHDHKPLAGRRHSIGQNLHDRRGSALDDAAQRFLHDIGKPPLDVSGRDHKIGERAQRLFDELPLGLHEARCLPAACPRGSAAGLKAALNTKDKNVATTG
jgi:hypothetical protein